jgi:hypothetical protein
MKESEVNIDQAPKELSKEELLQQLETKHNPEDMCAAFFGKYENILPKGIKACSLKELQRVITYTIFGELSKKNYKLLSDNEKALSYHLRQAMEDRFVMEVYQAQVDEEKKRLKKELKEEQVNNEVKSSEGESDGSNKEVQTN